MPEVAHTQKITFGVRGLLIYCSDYKSAIGRGSVPTPVRGGRMMSGCPMSSRVLSAKRAARAVPKSDFDWDKPTAAIALKLPESQSHLPASDAAATTLPRDFRSISAKAVYLYGILRILVDSL